MAGRRWRTLQVRLRDGDNRTANHPAGDIPRSRLRQLRKLPAELGEHLRAGIDERRVVV